MAEEPGYTGEGNEVWRKGQDILVRVMRCGGRARIYW